MLLTGGAIAAAIALAPPAGARPVAALSWLLFTGSSVHVASTGWLFTVPEVRGYARAHAIRCLWVPAALIVAGAVVAALVPPRAFGWLLLPYFCWQFFHYQKQNIGMAALAASAQRVRPLLPAERRALLLAGGAAIAALVAEPRLLGLRVDPVRALLPGWAVTGWPLSGWSLPGWALPGGRSLLFVLAAAAFALAAVSGCAALARRPAAQRPAFSLTYLSCLMFSLPVFVFGAPYAAIGGMTAAHGLQYLLLVSLVAGSAQGEVTVASAAAGSDATGRGATEPQEPEAPTVRAPTASVNPSRRSRPTWPGRLVRLGLLANIALIGGAMLGGASHRHDAGPAGRLIFGAYLGVVMAHFVIDAGLWRMRDPLARQFMTSKLPYLVRASPPAGPATRPVPGPAIALTDPSSADIGCSP